MVLFIPNKKKKCTKNKAVTTTYSPINFLTFFKTLSCSGS